MYLNNKEHASALVDGGMLTTRLHELSVLANMGVIQVEWSRAWKTMEDFTRERASGKATGELSLENYTKVRDLMQKGTTASQGKGPPTEKSPDDKAAGDARKTKATVLQAAQNAITSYTGKVSGSHLSPIYEKLAARPWGQSARADIEKQVRETAVVVAELHAAWSSEALRLKTAPPDFDEILLERKTKAVESMWAALDAPYIADIEAMK